MVVASFCSLSFREAKKFIPSRNIENGGFRDFCRHQLSRRRDRCSPCLRRELWLVHESQPALRGGTRQERPAEGGGAEKAGRVPALHLRACWQSYYRLDARRLARSPWRRAG